MKKYPTIDAYIENTPLVTQPVLQKVRMIIKKASPKSATEDIKYGLPTIIFYGNLVHFGGYDSHIGLYPGSEAIKIFKKDLAKYDCSKGTIRFPINKVPFPLITKITKYRVQASMEAHAKKAGVVFHTDGSIWAKGKKVGGKMDGYWEWYRKDGTKLRSGYFKKDKKIGKWITYDLKGKIYKVTDMGK